MTKNINLPRGPGAVVVPTPQDAAQAKAANGSSKPKSTTTARPSARPAAKKPTPKKPGAAGDPRIRRQRGTHRAGHVAAHGEHGEEGDLNVGVVDPLLEVEEHHRRTHATHALERPDLDDKVEVRAEHEEKETGATGPDAITRSGGESSGDGFDENKGQHEAYARYLRGNVERDADRFRELREKGKRDDFDLHRTPTDVEALGINRAAAHVIRCYDAWTLAGIDRAGAIEKTAALLAGFGSVQNIRRVLQELEVKPIRDVYPLEVLVHLLKAHPDLLPGVRAGEVLLNVDALSTGQRIFAGHPVKIDVPADLRLKSFALLGGGRPGYEFEPAIEEDRYSLLVDTPGHYSFAVLGAPLTDLGRIKRETQEALLQIVRVTVYAMGKKGEPQSPEEWAAEHGFEDDNGDDDDGAEVSRSGSGGSDDEVARVARTLVNEDSGGAAAAQPHPTLAVQIRAALERITPDVAQGESIASTNRAATYSWDVNFYRSNAPAGAEPILHIVVKSAAPFDAAWHRAREAIIQKQREHEPGRAALTADDVTLALQRARARQSN